ncbi:MAG: hypothetical protein M0022_09155 [Desulfobacteraceae bacterium]|nr:hypothetical protein [Desulfobacteraceae bacterium]
MSGNQFLQPISGSNLSYAWANAFLTCYEASGGVLTPAVVRYPSCDANGTVEDSDIRSIIDSHLADASKFIPGQSVIETVANTIFPESIWQLCQGDRELLYKKYTSMLPFIRRKPANRRGVYFQRMIAYPSNQDDETSINQLEHIIKTWKSGNHRHSALQIGIFDPRSDHSNAPLQGFPCLQQISFHANGPNGRDGLSVVAFYANQTLEEKAYGNYLGLHRLGVFMAKEMGLQLKEIICIASALKLNNAGGKGRCKSLIEDLKARPQNA